MTTSRSARERKAASEAGPLARVKIDLDGQKQFVYKISCTECVVRDELAWSAYRPGGDNGFMAAMDRWIFHLNEKHPGVDAPCLAFLPAAQQRLHERRAEQEGDPALELALARAMLTQARLGQLEESLRIYRPASAVVVFGRRDTHLPGFPRAVEAARAAGFEPVVRATGGRAVAYTGAALVVDHVRREPGPIGGQEARFAEFGQRFVDLFRGFGVDARLGAVPGEYCPGAHSVNARGVEKLVGTAQRMVAGAWLFSSLVVVGDEGALRPVLEEVYRSLGQDFDASSVGSLSREVPGLDIDAVEAGVVDAYRAGGSTVPAQVDTGLLELARSLVVEHRVD